MSFAHLLETHMKKRRLSDEGTARLVGVASATVRKWRNGESLPNMGYGMALSRAFAIAPAKLLEACADQRAARGV